MAVKIHIVILYIQYVAPNHWYPPTRHMLYTRRPQFECSATSHCKSFIEPSRWHLDHTSFMLQYLNGTVLDICHSIFHCYIFYKLLKWHLWNVQGITNSLNFHAVEHVTRFWAMVCAGQYHFEAIEQLGGRNKYGIENCDMWRYNA